MLNPIFSALGRKNGALCCHLHKKIVTTDLVSILANLAIFVAQISAGEGQDLTDFCGRWKIDIFDCVCGWVTAKSLR